MVKRVTLHLVVLFIIGAPLVPLSASPRILKKKAGTSRTYCYPKLSGGHLYAVCCETTTDTCTQSPLV